MIDIQKVCSEKADLVEKIMIFDSGDFSFSNKQDPMKTKNGTWTLGKVSKTLNGLDHFKLKFKNHKLKTISYGPRSPFEDDMKKLGVNLYFVRDKKNRQIESFEKGPFYVKDLAGRKMRIEHNGSSTQGVTVHCF